MVDPLLVLVPIPFYILTLIKKPYWYGGLLIQRGSILLIFVLVLYIFSGLGDQYIVACFLNSAYLLFIFFITIRLNVDDQKALILLADTQALLAERKMTLEETNRQVTLGNIDLERANKKMSLVLETASDAFISTDGSGVILEWNRRAETMFGLTRGEIIGQKMNVILIPDRYQKEIDNEMMQFVTSSDKYVIDKLMEIRGFRKDGSEFPAEMSLSILRYDDDFIFNAFIRDISDRKQLELMKDEFLSTVSHELRTPLAIIKGAVSNLKDGILGPLTEKQQKVIETTNRNVSRLTRLINDLLDLSRLESGKVTAKLESLDIVPFLKDLVGSFKALDKSKNITLECETPTDFSSLKADPDMMTQLVSNLLSNAVRYCKSNISVKLFVESKMNQKDLAMPMIKYWHLVVSDDGEGISKENLPVLFNKFQQINRPQGGSGYKGTGLGLAICKEIVNLHQGEIWAESELGHGAHFHVLLPAGI